MYRYIYERFRRLSEEVLLFPLVMGIALVTLLWIVTMEYVVMPFLPEARRKAIAWDLQYWYE